MISTPENPHTLADEVKSVINNRLQMQKQTKKWLAARTGTDYGRVKRVLNSTDSQPMTVDEADQMLLALGSSLRDALTAPVIDTLAEDIAQSLKKMRVNWR